MSISSVSSVLQSSVPAKPTNILSAKPRDPDHDGDTDPVGTVDKDLGKGNTNSLLLNIKA